MTEFKVRFLDCIASIINSMRWATSCSAAAGEADRILKKMGEFICLSGRCLVRAGNVGVDSNI